MDINYSKHYSNFSDDPGHLNEIFLKNFFTNHPLYSIKSEDAILDIGCALAKHLRYLKSVGFKNLTGVEKDKHLYNSIQDLDGVNIFNKCAFDFLENVKSKYKCILLLDVLEHLEKDKQLELLTLAESALDENGILLIQTPNALNPVSSYFRYIDWTHEIAFTENSLIFLLESAGFPNNLIRPFAFERKDIVRLKRKYAKLLYLEFGLENQILTPNLVSVSFKNSRIYDEYKLNAPCLNVDYGEYAWVRNLANNFKSLLHPLSNLKKL